VKQIRARSDKSSAEAGSCANSSSLCLLTSVIYLFKNQQPPVDLEGGAKMRPHENAIAERV
jgi:hypothetical protein